MFVEVWDVVVCETEDSVFELDFQPPYVRRDCASVVSNAVKNRAMANSKLESVGRFTSTSFNKMATDLSRMSTS